MISYLAFSGENLLKGRVWTLVTSLFIHGDFLHLLGNMLFLFVFGNTLENELEETKTLVAFFVGGTLSFLLSTLFYDAIIYFIYNILATYFGFLGNVAYISHVIGFMIGIPLGIAWSENWVKNLLITVGLFLIYLFIVVFLVP